MADLQRLVTPCGLFCGACHEALVDHTCHGCGCSCGECSGAKRAQRCQIALCAAGKGYATCAECDEMPCTALIEFAHDPIWRTHLPVIEHLRRIRRIGTDAFAREQQAYYADERRLKRFLTLWAECAENARRERGG